MSAFSVCSASAALSTFSDRGPQSGEAEDVVDAFSLAPFPSLQAEGNWYRPANGRSPVHLQSEDSGISADVLEGGLASFL